MKNFIGSSLVILCIILSYCSSSQKILNLSLLKPSTKISFIEDSQNLKIYSSDSLGSYILNPDIQNIKEYCWSPSEEKILYKAYGSNTYNIYNRTNNEIISVENLGNEVKWLGDNHLLYVNSTGVYDLDINSNKKKRIIIKNDLTDIKIYENTYLLCNKIDSLFVFKILNDSTYNLLMHSNYKNIYDYSLSNNRTLLAISHDNQITILNIFNNSPEKVYECKHVAYWLDWLADDSAIVFLEGKPSYSYGFELTGIKGVDGTRGIKDYTSRSKGYFYFRKLIISDEKFKRTTLFKNIFDVSDVNPDISKNKELIGFICNSGNSIRKVFIISTKSGEYVQLGGSGIYSLPKFIN